MKSNWLVASFLIFAPFFLTSCKKESGSRQSDKENENTLAANARLLDTNFISNVTEHSFILSKSSPTTLKVGDVVLSAPTIENPYGMMRKILGVSETSSGYMLQTEQSNLNDAFQELHIDYTMSESYDSSVVFKQTSGSRTFSAMFDNEIAKSVRVNAKLQFQMPTIRVEYEKKRGSFEPEKFLLQADLKSKGSTFEIMCNATSPVHIEETELASYNLPPFNIIIPITTPIGIFPFPLKMSQKIVLNWLPFEIGAKTTLKFRPEISVVMGCKYENQTWTNLSTFSIEASDNSQFSKEYYAGSFNAAFTIIKPTYEVKPYNLDAISAFFEVPNVLELDIKPTQPNYLLTYSLDVTAGIKTEFWTGVDQTYSITGNVIDKILAQGSWPQTSTPIIGKWRWYQQNIDGVVTPRIGSYVWFMEDGTLKNGIDGSAGVDWDYYPTYSWNLNGDILQMAGESCKVISLDSSLLIYQRTDYLPSIVYYYFNRY